MDESVGVSSTSPDIAVALGLALSSDTIRRWVLSRMDEKLNSKAYGKVTESSISYVACASAPHSGTTLRSGPCTRADVVQDGLAGDIWRRKS